MNSDCVHALFESQVEKQPERPALILGDETLTYGELNVRASALAYSLAEAGCRPDALIGLHASRGFDLIIGIFGILKAGGAYVPLDPGYPESRLRLLIEDAGISLIVSDRPLASGHNDFRCRVIEVDSSNLERLRPTSVVSGNNSAYAIYTSGSTGTPKGVVLNHLGLRKLIEFAGEQMEIRPSDRILQFAAFTFDASVWEIFAALSHGATLVLARREDLFPGLPLRELIRRHEVTIVLLSPPVLQVVSPEGLNSVRIAIAGGEKCTRQVVRRWADGRRFFNAYGPSEATIYATISEVDLAIQDDPSIGWPVPGTTCLVLDQAGHQASPGEAGELLIGGISVGRGYINRPELTAEKFVTLPTNDHKERYFRTGDRVRVRADGAFDYLGRIDRQVKVRGYRVEPGEIENSLESHPAVASSVVVARSDPAGGRSLIAFYVAAADRPVPASRELSTHLSRTLPEYMVPSHFVPRNDWPLNAHGKVDREALLAGISESNRWLNVATSSTEERLRALCRKTIGASPAGLEDSLIELGLHSLSAANLAWLIHEEFQVSLQLSDVLESPTLGELLARIERGPASPATISRPRVSDRATRPDFLPVSFPQEQVWFLEKLHPHLNSYRFQALFHCRGKLDVEVLEATLNRIVARHEVLRTAFTAGEGGSPRQDIRPHVPFRLVIEDLESLPAESRQKEIDRLISEELGRQFDLANPPLIRWRLFRLNEHDHKLLHTEHHFLHDGWGYAEFLREFYAIYSALLEGKELTSQREPMQFADFALWQRETLMTGAWDDQLEFWRKELDQCPPPPSLPSDRRITGVRTFAGLQIRRPLPEALWEDIGRACSQEGVTRFAWIQAAFLLFIHRYTGAEDFCVGSGFANRRDPRLQEMLGMAINTLPVRARLKSIHSFRDLAKSASHSLSAIFENQELPFERVVQTLNPSRGPDSNPFFNTFIGSYENAFPRFRSEELEITSDDGISCGQVKFDIVALLVPQHDHSVSSPVPGRPPVPLLLWEFSSELFERETAERMLEHFLQLLESSVQDPDASIRSLPMISSEEQRRLVTLGKAPSPELPALPIHQLFEAVAASRQDARAVVWGGGSLTYGELSKRSGKLAHYLRDQGVERGARIALCMDRSPEMIVGMLAILKAGATYLPLDPTYPKERLRLIVEDAAAAVVLTLAEVSEALPQCPAKVIAIDREWPLIEASDCELVAELRPEEPAYVIFTSGSTGTPKGVAVPHRAVVRLVIDTNYVELRATERIAHLSNICFDAATFEIWGALLNGASVVIIPKDVALDPRKFGELLKRYEVSTVFLTTALFNELAREDGTIFQSLNQVLFGGEAVTPHWVRHVIECGPPKRLLHVYGPTECTTFATFYPVTHVEKDAGTIPIGRPISNTTAYVLDCEGKPAPLGVPGELYLGGKGLALGYMGQPELTREKFVTNRFADTDDHLYRTGDIVRYLSDGNIEFLGRADRQVKIRGFRIEPEEVEAVLKRHRGLEDAIVIAREDGPGVRQLTAYIVPRNGEPTSDWASFLRSRLPDYMIPSAFVLLDKLPLTPNGKVDRGALPAPERRSEAYRAPSTAQEQILCQIFAEVLKLERVGVDDNFFALGGHSLLAMQLVNRIRESLGTELDVEIPLRAIFENPTASALSEVTKNITWAAGETGRTPEKREEMVL